MLRKNFPHRKQQRKLDAIERNKKYSLLTIEEKISKLPIDGASKQRKKFGL